MVLTQVFLWTQAIRGHALRCMHAIAAACGDVAPSVLSERRLITRGDAGTVPKNFTDAQFAYSAVVDRLGRHPLPIALDDNAAVALVWAVRSQPNVMQSPPFVYGADGWAADSFLLVMLERLHASHRLFFGRWDGMVRQFAAAMRADCSTEEQYRAFLKETMDLCCSDIDRLPAMHQIAKLHQSALSRLLEREGARLGLGVPEVLASSGAAEVRGDVPCEFSVC
jgi:hypothetical protein